MKLLRFHVFLLLLVLPVHAQEDAPNFDDIFVTDNIIPVNAPPTPEPLQQIILPSSVDACPPHSSGRLEAASPDGRHLVYGGCTFPQATELLNIPISLYDTQTGKTFSIGSTPLYTSVGLIEWLDSEHLVLGGEAKGAIGAASRGIIIVDTAERKLVNIGGAGVRPPHRVAGTATFEWVEFSFMDGNDYMTYDALSGEREKLFAIPENPLNLDVTSLYAVSNRSAANPEPDLIAVTFWPGGDRSITNIYNLTTGERLHEQETNNRYTEAYWVDSSRLLLLDTNWRIPSAILIEINGGHVQTQSIDNIYTNLEEPPQVSRALSMSHRYLLLRRQNGQIDVMDLASIELFPLVNESPRGYTLSLMWTTEDLLSAVLLNRDDVITQWFLKLEIGN